jgi:hypothetical protein
MVVSENLGSCSSLKVVTWGKEYATFQFISKLECLSVASFATALAAKKMGQSYKTFYGRKL